MKKLSQLLLIICLGIGMSSLQAQSDVDEYFDESGGSFKSKLWYGGGFNLGFSGSNSYNVFSFGLSPMVGYKVFEGFSAGPRVSIQYSYVKGDGRNSSGNISTYSVDPISYSVGLFARYKFLANVFGHIEIDTESRKNIYTDGDLLAIENEEVVTQRETRSNFYLGAGYHDGNGLWGYEVVFLYNINADSNDIELPFDFRFGINYKF